MGVRGGLVWAGPWGERKLTEADGAIQIGGQTSGPEGERRDRKIIANNYVTMVREKGQFCAKCKKMLEFTYRLYTEGEVAQ